MIIKQIKTVPDRVAACYLTWLYLSSVRAEPKHRLTRDEAAQLRGDIEFHRSMVQVTLNG